MRITLTIAIFLLTCTAAFAQFPQADTTKIIPPKDPAKTYICTPRSHMLNPPLFVVISKGKEFRLKNNGMLSDVLNVNWIKAISILKDTAAVNRYGDQARYGAVLVTINDDKFPKAYKQIKKAVKKAN